ncbi:MAG: pantoate--beta-alanine ligase [Candidatus Omnitrophota bacterium]|nr:pantoate--beta-alanine ligase [Candidatus Omnitrophota bacterium]MBU1894488.1 pantoate--beta-alanine ligase [Candidatus Omnitrophota bacterium]
MEFFTAIQDIGVYVKNAKRNCKTIGLVPTMGSLHEGHLSLVRAAADECDVVIVSVFVNKKQFSAGEDFDKYPRDIKRDREILESANVDVLFAPTNAEMYPDSLATYVEVDAKLANCLCGATRPGHFRGVTTVVAKLFNICQPDMSYFGQKDAQQAVIIKRMACDLNFSTGISVMPIIRDNDGLAMSSRNSYLSENERIQALSLYKALCAVKKMVEQGEVCSSRIFRKIKQILISEKDIKIDYIAIVDNESLQPVETIKEKTLIAVAIFVGNTRLIDNVVVDGES